MSTYGDPDYCPDYGDPILVPTCWYQERWSWQTVWKSWDMGYPKDYEPVVMKGSRHCRVWKHGTHRELGTAVMTRYVRRLRITMHRRDKWHDFVTTHLVPKMLNAHWYYRQRNVYYDLTSMVDGESTVLIDGEVVTCRDSIAYRNVVTLIESMRKLDRQMLKRAQVISGTTQQAT